MPPQGPQPSASRLPVILAAIVAVAGLAVAIVIVVVGRTGTDPGPVAGGSGSSTTSEPSSGNADVATNKPIDPVEGYLAAVKADDKDTGLTYLCSSYKQVMEKDKEKFGSEEGVTFKHGDVQLDSDTSGTVDVTASYKGQTLTVVYVLKVEDKEWKICNIKK